MWNNMVLYDTHDITLSQERSQNDTVNYVCVQKSTTVNPAFHILCLKNRNIP